MPQRENAERKVNRPEQEDAASDVQAQSTSAEHKAALDADVDSLLDEIDEVLEINAEEFVKSFVQKGGQ
jgi:ubiquitin-like protein Pup